jgi:hypothetical protein
MLVQGEGEKAQGMAGTDNPSWISLKSADRNSEGRHGRCRAENSLDWHFPA